MKEKYDFILFENYHQAQNHKIDLVLIAHMLQSQGLKVAILNVYGEDNSSHIEGVEVLNLPFKAKRPICHKVIGRVELLVWQRLYFKKVLQFIVPLAKNFYFGSYHFLLPSILLKVKKPCYYWGLRSSRMCNFIRIFKSDGIITSLHARKLANTFIKNKYQGLFVSNEIIKKEFEKLGIDAARLAIREERCIETITETYIDKCSKTPSFLVIGQLRKQKHIPTTIKAFKTAAIPDSMLYLVGRSRENYESVINNAIANDKRIERDNQFLSYEDFMDYYHKAHFILFADEQGDSCITNGTFTEALIQHRPVIAPDYNPYSYYINKYGVGLLYEPDNIQSYSNAMKKAIELGVEHFQPNINNFLEEIKFDKVSKLLVEQIRSNRQS